MLYIQEAVKAMPVADHVFDFAAQLVRATRCGEPGALEVARRYLTFGAGPRASLGLIMAAKARAVLRGQAYTACEDVAAVAHAVLRHRVAVNFTAQGEGITPDAVIDQVLKAIPAH